MPFEFMDRYEMLFQRILEKLPEAKNVLLAFYPSNLEAAPDPHTREIFRCRTNERIRQDNEAQGACAKIIRMKR